MKKTIFLFVLLISVLTGCGFFDDNDKIVIGIDDDFAPISFRDEKNEIVGFDIDLAKETARRMGVAVEFKPIGWDKKKEELTSGNVDLIWNGLDITEERKEYMIFSKSYMEDRQIILIRTDSDFKIHSEYDLEGKIIGVQAGSSSDDYINKNEKLKKSFKDYKIYSKFTEVINALKNEEIEVIVCDEIVARYEMNKNPDCLKIIDVKIGSIFDMAIGFRKDKVALRDKVQKVFDEMIKDGTAQDISEKWFNADLIKSRI